MAKFYPASGYTSNYASNPNNYKKNQSTVPYQGPVLPGLDTNYFRSTGQNKTPGGSVLGLNSAQYQGGSQPAQNIGNPQMNLGNVLEQQTQFQDPGLPDISEGLNALQQQEDAIRGSISSEDQRLSGIQVSETESANQEIARAEQTGVVGKARANQELTSATDEARRQFSEQQLGLHALYGSSTGTGRFVSELAGRETLKNISAYRTNYQNFVTDIDSRIENTRSDAVKRIREINDQTNYLKSQLKSTLDQRLSEIGQGKQSLKSNAYAERTQALRDYQQLVAGVNQRNTQFLQGIYSQVQQQQTQYQNAKQSAQARALALEQEANQYTIDRLSQLQLGGALNETGQARLGEYLGVPGGIAPLKPKQDQSKDEWSEFLKQQGFATQGVN